MNKLFLLLLFLTPFVHADEMHISDISQGMYSYPSPNKIPDASAAYIQNFFTDIQSMAVERNGSVLVDSNVGGINKSIAGLWKFVDVSNNEWIIEYSSRTFYKHLIGNAPTAFGPITTTSNVPRAATNLGKIMFVDGVDNDWTFDGTSTAAVAGAPIGTLILPWRTRFVIANIAGAQSTVRFSADGDATTWALGPNATDPFFIQIGGANDGSYVRCIGNYEDYLIIQRKYDTWAVSGFDQSDVQNRNISTEIGCIEPGTNREFDGVYLFLSWRGMESMNGFGITSVSDPIRNVTDVLVKNTANQRSNLQTTGADWAAASLNSSTWIDTVTAPGQLQLAFPDYFDAIRDGTLGTKPVWTKYCYSPFGLCTPNITANSGVATFSTVSGNDGQTLTAPAYGLLGTSAGTTYYLKISSITPNVVSGNNQLSLMIYNVGTTSSDPRTLGTGVYFSFKSTDTGNYFLYQVGSTISGSGTADGCTNCAGDVPYGTQAFMYFTGSRYLVTFSNGAPSVTGALTQGNFNGQAYLSYKDGSGTSSAQIDEFGLAPISVQISSPLLPQATSQLLTIGSAISSWGAVTISDVHTGGSINYLFGSTNTANRAAITNYTAVSNGQVPSVPVGSFAAFQSSFTQTVSSGILSLDYFQTTWNEGGGTQPPISINYDRRYWLSLTTSTTAGSTLDTIFVFQRNHTWTSLKGLNAASFSLWRDNLVFGDATTGGNVYQYDVGNNDNGAAITSQIIFKSYDAGTSYRDKDFRRTYLTFLGGTSGTFSFGFYNEQGTTLYNLGTANLTDGIGQVFEKFHFPLDGTVPLQGREIQYALTKSGTGDRLKVFDITLDFTPKEAR